MFEFLSGLAHHPSGHGAWHTKITRDGTFSTQHIVGDQTTDYGPFELTAQENSLVWHLIESAQLEKLVSSERTGVPDEVQYTFKIHPKNADSGNSDAHVVTLWVSEALQALRIAVLVMQLGTLIENYTHQTPTIH